MLPARQELYEARDRDAALRGSAEAALQDAALARAAAAAAAADAAETRRVAAAGFAAAAFAPPPPAHAALHAHAAAARVSASGAAAGDARLGGGAGSPPPPPAPAQLFAVGGLSRAAAPLASCEAFDPVSSAWRPLPALSCARGYCAAAAAGGCGRRGAATLYALGGSGGGAPLDSCEALLPGAASWRRVAPMGTPRVWHAAAVLGHAVYVVGGYDGARALAAAEALHTEVDAPRGIWKQLAVRRACHVIASLCATHRLPRTAP